MEQNTQEWLEFRKSKVGGSDAPIIMQESPFKTPYQLWKEKLDIEQSPQTWAMKRGHQLEPIARKALEEKLGMPLESKIRLHNQRSWMIASLDAQSVDGSIIGEIKCPGKEDHELALSGKVPDKYFAQLQHQMEVCEVDFNYYFSWYEETYALIKVYRDDKYIKRLIVEEERFYECMKNFEAPDLIERDYIQQDSSHWNQLSERLKTIKKYIAEEEDIKKELISLAGGRNCMGAGIKVSMCSRKGGIDYGKVPQLVGLDLEPYRKPNSQYWQVRSN